MLFADLYAANRDAFAIKPMRLGVPELHFYFDPAESFLVRKHVANPDDFIGALLPPDYQPVRLTCLLFGGIPPDMTMSYLSFYAEKDMGRLLQVKGRTGGLSTDKLEGKNCHVTGFPVGIDEPREWVLVTKDDV